MMSKLKLPTEKAPFSPFLIPQFPASQLKFCLYFKQDTLRLSFVLFYFLFFCICLFCPHFQFEFAGCGNCSIGWLVYVFVSIPVCVCGCVRVCECASVAYYMLIHMFKLISRFALFPAGKLRSETGRIRDAD